MQVSVESTHGLERKMTVEVPAERIDKEVQNRLVSMAKKAKVHGFRPGKVPFSVVERQFKDQVQSDVINEVMQSSFYEALAQEKLLPAGAPSIEPISRTPGQALSYTATFEVYPEIGLASLDNVEIDKPAAQITEQDIDNVIETIRKQRVEWIVVDREAKPGDQVRIDFHGTIDGEVFQGNEGKDVPIEIGAKRMIAGFEEQLEGIKAGDQRILELNFPEDYQRKELAGKLVKFDVKANAVEEAKLPEINEEFCRNLGIEDGNMEKLRSEVRDNMQREMEEKIKSVTKQNVMSKLLEINQIQIPNSLVDKEIQALASRNLGELSEQKKLDKNQLEAMFSTEAKRRVTLGLVLSEIAKQNNIKAEPTKVRQLVENIASTYEKPQEIVQWYYADKRHLGEIESLAVENEVVDWVLGHAIVKETSTTFDALMNPGQTK